MEDNAVINIKEGTVRINNSAFHRPSEYGLGPGWPIKEVVIPSSVKSIGDYGFYWCLKLKKATFMGDAPIEFGNYVFDTFGIFREDFTIYFNRDAKDFTSPLWNGYNATQISPIKTMVTTLENQYKFDVSCPYEITSGTVVIALYNEYGKMISMKTFNVNQNATQTFDKIGTEKNWKVFVWNGLGNLLPQCKNDNGSL